MGDPRRASSGHHWTSQGQTAAEGASAQGTDWSLHWSLSFVQSLSSSVLLKRLGAFPTIHCRQTRDPQPNPHQESQGAHGT